MVEAVGRKCILRLVGVPFEADAWAGLPGAEAVVQCDSFLDGPAAYGACWLAGQSEFYFPAVAVRCLAYDEDARALVVGFAGPLLETHWDVAVAGPVHGPLASGRVICRVVES